VDIQGKNLELDRSFIYTILFVNPNKYLGQLLTNKKKYLVNIQPEELTCVSGLLLIVCSMIYEEKLGGLKPHFPNFLVPPQILRYSTNRPSGY
jgi:hypothetical protein